MDTQTQWRNAAADEAHRRHCIDANRAEYGNRYPDLRFVDDARAAEATARRAEILAGLAASGRVGCSGTKADVSRLAPGCRICGEGLWSCLFINNICNAQCAYCPAPQQETGPPATNSLTFPDPDEYAEFVGRTGVRGVSISGGEPLLTLQRTLRFISVLKRRFGATLHLWLYTNGRLASPQTVAKLRDAGLDEIRFDIGAMDYDLSAPALAVGVIPCVIVEVPLLPEKIAVVEEAVGRMEGAGINAVNLHQLRLTPHNLPRLVDRGYTFVHGEKVTVLESELGVLELICRLRERGSEFPANYCSFAYKHRFQRAGVRRRAAALVLRPGEQITEAGFIRQGGPGRATYFEATFREAPSYMNPYVEMELSSGRSVVVERRLVGTAAAQEGTENADGAPPPGDPASPWESIPYGLPAYF